jgi:hypothetical protein
MVMKENTVGIASAGRLYGLDNYRSQLRAALENKHVVGTPDTD